MVLPNKKRTRMISMKLKDNFYKIVPCDETDKYEQAVDNCVKISKDYADEFSIGFAEWTHNLRNACEKDNAECNKWENISNKELLKIYKKEKGL